KVTALTALDVSGTVSGSALTVSGLSACTNIQSSAAGVLSCNNTAYLTSSPVAGQGLTFANNNYSLNATITGSLVRFQTLSGVTVTASRYLSSSGVLSVKKLAGTSTGNILTVDTKGLVYDATN